MAEHYGAFTSAGAVVLAVTRDSEAAAQEYFAYNKVPFPCLLDAAGDVYRQYDVGSEAISLGQRPALYIIDAQGIVQFAHVGWQQWEIPRNEDVLRVCDAIPCRAESTQG